jgi:5-methylcytosine-specific restriction endonuclease McrA
MLYLGDRCYLQLNGCTGTGDTIDHVKPLNKGGAHMLANMRLACRSCNSSKNDKWPYPAVTNRVGC